MQTVQELSVVLLAAPKGDGIIASHLMGVQQDDAKFPQTKHITTLEDPAAVTQQIAIHLTLAPFRLREMRLLETHLKSAHVVIFCTPLQDYLPHKKKNATTPFLQLTEFYAQMETNERHRIQHFQLQDLATQELASRQKPDDLNFSCPLFNIGMPFSEDDANLYHAIASLRNVNGQSFLRIWVLIEDSEVRDEEKHEAIEKIQSSLHDNVVDCMIIFNSTNRSSLLFTAASIPRPVNLLSWSGLIQTWQHKMHHDEKEEEREQVVENPKNILQPWQITDISLPPLSDISLLAVGLPKSGKSKLFATILRHSPSAARYVPTSEITYQRISLPYDGHNLHFRFFECPRQFDEKHFNHIAQNVSVIAYFITAAELRSSSSHELAYFKQLAQQCEQELKNKILEILEQQHIMWLYCTTEEEHRCIEEMTKEKLKIIRDTQKGQKKIHLLIITQADRMFSEKELRRIYTQFPFMLCCIIPQLDSPAVQKKFLPDLAQWYYQHPIGQRRPLNRPFPEKPPRIAPSHFGIAFAAGGLASLFIFPGLSQWIGIASLVQVGAQLLHNVLPFINPVLSFLLVKALACLLLALLIFAVVVTAVNVLYWVDKKWRAYQERRNLAALPQQYEWVDPVAMNWHKGGSLFASGLEEVIIPTREKDQAVIEVLSPAPILAPEYSVKSLFASGA